MLVFFEIDKINIERFYFNRFKKRVDLEKVVVVLEDPHEMELFKKKYPKVKSYQFYDWIRGVAKSYKSSYVFINGNRIPDLLMTKISTKYGCKVIFLQHGMYVDFMKREIKLFVRKFKKSLRYAHYAMILNKPISLFKIHVFGSSRGLVSNTKQLYPLVAFVYSEYWKEWHNKTFFFNQTKFYYFINNNDSNQSLIRMSNTVVYCYQTLVEDGRIDESYFNTVVNEIISAVKKSNFNLVVKGHPRMSKSRVRTFMENGIPVEMNKFPTGGVVIGHYSTLLARWAYEGDSLILIDLKGHEIPQLLKDLSTKICSVKDLYFELKNLKAYDKEELKNKSDFYFNFSGKESVGTVSEMINLTRKIPFAQHDI